MGGENDVVLEGSLIWVPSEKHVESFRDNLSQTISGMFMVPIGTTMVQFFWQDVSF